MQPLRSEPRSPGGFFWEAGSAHTTEALLPREKGPLRGH